MRYLAMFALLALGVLTAPGAEAHSSTVTVPYSPGWNMVGGPSGTDFSIAGSLYAYESGGYAVLKATTVASCQGYWAYLSNPATVSLAGSATGPMHSCALQSGWNLVGNPFAGVAQLPVGTVAYRWSPTAGAYRSVNSIPAGGAAWIYSDSIASITLQFVPASSGALVIHGLTNLGPYQVHVGDTVTLVLPPSPRVLASASSSLLQLEASGESEDGNFWTWRAVAPGTAVIALEVMCLQRELPCVEPAGLEIQVDILP